MPEGKQLVIMNLKPIHLVHCKMARGHERVETYQRVKINHKDVKLKFKLIG